MKNNFSAIRFQGLEKTRGKVPSLGKNSARFSKPWKISARLFPRLGILALLVFQSLETPAATNAPLPAVIGPYLQNPASDGMTVCLLAQGAQRVRVAWGAAVRETFPPEVHKAQPYLKHCAVYREPLFALATLDLDRGTLVIEGRRTDWIGPDPWQRGASEKDYPRERTRPAISGRQFQLTPPAGSAR